MFLDLLQAKNPQLIQAAVALHQQGKIPANCYVIDLDMVEKNARLFKLQADKHALKVFAMTKQVGRHSGFNKALMRGGIESAVAVDMACAVACHEAGLKVGHIGHLVQIPFADAPYVASIIQPDYWTVFSEEKAVEAAQASKKAGRKQKILARIQTTGDQFYRGHEGGFPAEKIVEVAQFIDNLDGAEFAGITSFPALMFDHESNEVLNTPNLATLTRAKEMLQQANYQNFEVNAPGTTSSIVLAQLQQAGATQCEPGNGLHGTTPLHAIRDLPEAPAVCYLSEVSHIHNDEAFAFGGGLYIDPVFPDYDVHCLVSDGKNLRKAPVFIPPPEAIDYYAMINQKVAEAKTGDSVVFGFRGQAFVTRALIAGVTGIAQQTPEVETIEDGFGHRVCWPYQNHNQPQKKNEMEK